MQPQLVDLHTHTSASDGTDTPTELIIKAAKKNLASIAITDHDTLSGLEEAEDAGKQYQVEVIRGCELGVASEYGEIHLLGLWIPHHAVQLEKALKTLRKHRDERNKLIVDKINRLGIPLEYEDIVAKSFGETVGRLHIAQALMEKGYVSSVAEAFHKYLGYNALAYIPKVTLQAKEGIRLLVDSGAMVSFAHPMLLKCPKDWLEATLLQFKEYGLSAIEAYHSDHSSQDERYCVELAHRYGLGLTGGSDYHGEGKPLISLGKGRGGMRITVTMLDMLKAQHNKLM